jgi:hypothetical protein
MVSDSVRALDATGMVGCFDTAGVVLRFIREPGFVSLPHRPVPWRFTAGTHAVTSQVITGTFQHCIAIDLIVPVPVSGSSLFSLVTDLSELKKSPPTPRLPGSCGASGIP